MVKAQADIAKAGVKYLGGAALGFIAYKLLSNGYNNLRRNLAQKDLLDKKEGQQAQVLKIAMNPSGFDWMMSFDGTNLTHVMAIAKEIKDFSTVQNYYGRLYPGRNLVNDLEAELSVNELSQFYSLLGTAQELNLSRMVSGSSPFRYSAGQNVQASGKPILYSKPQGQAVFQMKEENAPLGKILARVIDAKGGLWYMVSLSGKRVFILQNDLR